MNKILNKIRQRGALFIEYALVLAFVIVVGVVFMTNENSKSIETVFSKTASTLEIAAGNDSGNSGGGQATPTPAPKPEDDPSFQHQTVKSGTYNGSLGNIGNQLRDAIWPLNMHMNPQTNQPYQPQEINYVSWDDDSNLTIAFNDGHSNTQNLSGTTSFINFKNNMGINSAGTIAYENGQLVQHNSDMYTYLELQDKTYGYKP